MIHAGMGDLFQSVTSGLLGIPIAGAAVIAPTTAQRIASSVAAQKTGGVQIQSNLLKLATNPIKLNAFSDGTGGGGGELTQAAPQFVQGPVAVEGGGVPRAVIIGGAAVGLLAVGLVIFKLKKKKK